MNLFFASNADADISQRNNIDAVWNSELSILILQTQVEELRGRIRETLNQEELSAALEELNSKGDKAFEIHREIRNKKSTVLDTEKGLLNSDESRINELIASVIAGFRFAMNRKAGAALEIKTAQNLLKLNQKLFGLMQSYSLEAKSKNPDLHREAIDHLLELTPSFVVLDPLAQNLRNENSELRANALVSLKLFSQILTLFEDVYDFASQNAGEFGRLSPYLQATEPGLKYALFSKQTRVQESARSALNQIESFTSRTASDLP